MNTPRADSNLQPVHVVITADVTGLKCGLVQANGLTISPSSPSFQEWCVAEVGTVRAAGMAGGELRREAVRKMLRAGGFKPAGRNKPAQEYLLRTLTENGSLPSILNAVDALNVISVKSGLPISLLAAERTGPSAVVRYGRADERFVFNRSGQELELEGLICICGTNDQPLGTPIKDSMLGKVSETDRDVVAVLYAPEEAVATDELLDWCRQLESAIQQGCSPAGTQSRVI